MDGSALAAAVSAHQFKLSASVLDTGEKTIVRAILASLEIANRSNNYHGLQCWVLSSENSVGLYPIGNYWSGSQRKQHMLRKQFQEFTQFIMRHKKE